MSSTEVVIRRLSLLTLVALLALVPGILATPQAVLAASIVVNTTDDELNTDGDCSLREAIEAANTDTAVDACVAGSGADTITFDASLSGGTIRLGSELSISTDVTIDGSSLASQLTISGDTDNNGSGDVRIFWANAGVTLALDSLVLTKGYSWEGGAIHSADNSPIINVYNSTFSANTSASNTDGGAIYGGTVHVVNSTFNNNTGARYCGAIQATVHITNSAFIGNQALNGSGGALRTGDGSTIVNSTFSGNSASWGGAIDAWGTTIINSTFSDNDATSGSNINNAGGTTTLSNSIIANGITSANCAGTVVNGGYNIDDGSSCGFGSANGSMSNTDPQLDVLVDNGGDTQTHALLGNSPALNAIPNGTSGCGVTYTDDQRGMPRPYPAGGACDVGAFELQVTPPETEISLDGSNNLGIIDINGGDSDDILTAKIDTANQWFEISDANLILTTTIGGAGGAGTHVVTVPLSLVAGDTVSATTLGGTDVITFESLLGYNLNVVGGAGTDVVTFQTSASDLRAGSVTAESVHIGTDLYGQGTLNGVVTVADGGALRPGLLPVPIIADDFSSHDHTGGTANLGSSWTSDWSDTTVSRYDLGDYSDTFVGTGLTLWNSRTFNDGSGTTDGSTRWVRVDLRDSRSYEQAIILDNPNVFEIQINQGRARFYLGGNYAQSSVSNLADNNYHTLVARITFDTSNGATGTLWVDPTEASNGVPTAYADVVTLNSSNLYASGFDSTLELKTVASTQAQEVVGGYDNIAIGRTLADVWSGAGVMQAAGDTTFQANAAFDADFAGTTPGNGPGYHDQLYVTGTVTIDSSAVLNLSARDGYVPGKSDTFVILSNDGTDAISGNFAGLPQDALITDFLGSGLDFVIDYSGGDGNDVELVLATPELDIVKTVDPTSAAPGDAITYTLAFSNGGTGTATGVVITDTLPVSVTNSGVVNSGAPITQQVGTRYVWDVADLAQGEGGIITITGTLSDPLAAGSFDNVATITTADEDSDLGNNEDSAGLTVLNAAPVAGDDGYATDEDTPLAVSAPGVLGNDSDPNDDALTAVLDDASQVNGALDFNADGSFVYTPTLNANGTFTFTYHANDGSLDSNIAVANITVNAVNDAPVATDNAYTLDEDSSSSGNVITDDTGDGVDDDIEGHSLTAGLVSDVDVGTLVLNPDGSFAYTPTLNYNGSVTFTYQLTDSVPHSGLFANSGQVLGGGRSEGIATGDLDDDGDLDLFIANLLDTQADTVWLNDGDGTFVSNGQSLLDGVSGSFDVALADLDGDTDLDAFVTNGHCCWSVSDTIWLNQGDGTFVQSPQIFPNWGSLGVALSDIDGDSDVDALISNGTVIAIWINDGSGSFAQDPQTLGGANSHLALGDVDGDNDPDVVSGSKLWLNDGSGTFSDSGQTLSGGDVALGDLDGDNDLDAVMLGNIWLNDGSGVFSDSGQSLPGKVVDLGDVDGDSDLDAFLISSNPSQVWLNDGSGTFSDSGQALPTGGREGEVVLGDFDGDGDLDSAVAKSANGGTHVNNEVWFNQNLPGLVSNVVTVTLTVNAVNDAPVAADDTFAADFNSSDNPLDVLANDTDVESKLSVGTVADPINGTATNNTTNILYTPDTDFFGTDVFTYTATDGALEDSATVTVTVTRPAYTCTAAGGLWSDAATWDCPGGPQAGDTVVIPDTISVTLDTDLPALDVYVEAGGTLAAGGSYDLGGSTATVSGTFRLDPGGFVQNGTFDYADGSTLAFNASGSAFSLDASHVFWPVDADGPDNLVVSGSGLHMNGVARTVDNAILTAGLEGSGSLTVNDTLTLGAGGWTSGVSYGAGATLVYDTGGSYSVGGEWTGSSAPANVTIAAGTALDLTNASSSLSLSGDLTIDGTLDLSADAGETLSVGGNFTVGTTGTFNANGQSVLFDGAALQTITGDPTFSSVTISTGTTVSGTLSGAITNDGTVAGGSLASGGTLTGGSVTGTVDNNGTLADTTIDALALVDNTDGALDGGNNNGSVTGGTVTGTVDNNGSLIETTIDASATVDNTNGTINGGTNDGTVTGGTLTGDLTNSGTLEDVTVDTGAIVTSGVISGTVTSSGLISSTTVYTGSTVAGGSLGGTVDNDGTLTDVNLAAGTTVTGGVISGTITGDPDNPATLSGVTVADGTSLAGVVVDASVTLPANLTLGDGVVLAPDVVLTGYTVDGSVQNNGTLEDITIQDGGVVSGGTISGTIVMSPTGVLEDVTVYTGTVASGGVISGTVTNYGELADVSLAADATITGGTLSGTVSGTAGAPATLNDVKVAAGTTLEHVVVTNSVTLPPDVVLGDGVVIQSGTTVFGGTLSGAVQNDGTLTNMTVASGATVDNAGGTVSGGTNDGTITGGTIAGSLTNNGELNDVTVAGGATVTGGTLSGTTTNDGTLTDVSFGPEAEVSGGTLSGTLSGTSGAPALLTDLTVTDGSTLTHVIIGLGVTLGEDVTLGAGVTYAYDVAILKTAEPKQADPGDPVTYTLSFANTGSFTATNVVITDSVPAQVLNPGWSSSGVQPTERGGTPYVWDIAELVPGAGGIITITGTLADPLPSGSINNTATITATYDLYLDNNKDSAGVSLQNLAPVALDDSYATVEDTPLTVPADGVLGNDSDPNDDALIAVLDDAGQVNGTLDFNGDGSFVYTPTLNANGTFTFTYHANDGSLDSNTATVSITVSGDNDAPVADDDTFTVAEDSTNNTLDVLEGDTDVDGDPLAISALGTPAHGSAVNNSTDVSYTPDPNFTGSDVFTYTVSDGRGGFDSATVTVNVTNANDAPVADDDTFTVAEDSVDNALDVLDGDTDADSDPLFVSAVGTPAHGTALNGTSVISYTPAADFNGTDTFTYTVADGQGGFDSATVTVNVTDTPDAPVLSNVTLTSTIEEGDSATLSGDVYEADATDPLTLTVDWGDGSAPEIFTYPAGTTAFSESHIYLDDDPAGTPSDDYTVAYTMEDVDGGDSGALGITVHNVAPQLQAVAATPLIDENEVVTATGAIVDPGAQDTFTLTVDWGDGSAPEVFTYPAGTVSFLETHRYLDDARPSTNFTLTFTLQDDDGGSDSATAPVQVTNVAPDLTDLSLPPVDEDESATLSGTIVEVGPQDTFTLTVNWGDGSAPERFTYPAGTTAFSESHIYLDDNPSGTPADDYEAILTLEDDDGGVAIEPLTTTVHNVAPQIATLTASDVDEGDATVLSGSIVDPGTQDTFTMTVDWDDGSAPESFTYPAGTTTFSETHTYLDDDPSGTPADDYTLSVTLSDDDTGSAGDSTVLTVHNVAPQVDAGADITVTLGTTVTFSGTYSDAGTLDTHTLEWDFGDGSIVTGTLTPTHTYAVGVYTATLTVTDDDGGAGNDIAVVTVERIKFYLPLVARN